MICNSIQLPGVREYTVASRGMRKTGEPADRGWGEVRGEFHHHCQKKVLTCLSLFVLPPYTLAMLHCTDPTRNSKSGFFLRSHNFTFENFEQENGQKSINMIINLVKMDKKF